MVSLCHGVAVVRAVPLTEDLSGGSSCSRRKTLIGLFIVRQTLLIQSAKAWYLGTGYEILVDSLQERRLSSQGRRQSSDDHSFWPHH